MALLQVTEKTDAYLDNLRVGLELWEKQLMLGGEVDNWAGAKLALFAESHPFHTEQQVLHMRVRPLCKAKCTTPILIPWSRYRFQNDTFCFDTRQIKSNLNSDKKIIAVIAQNFYFPFYW